eukprot:5152991-Pyramimonas_sp.AAC.1
MEQERGIGSMSRLSPPKDGPGGPRDRTKRHTPDHYQPRTGFALKSQGIPKIDIVMRRCPA